VLLHQVAPDWDTILDMYAKNVRALVIYNQQWTGPGNNVRLLDLGEEEYFRDVHHIWQWGITDADLEAKVAGLGFKLLHKKNCGRFGRLPNFENHAFIFARQ
jgi:hypothetical protein